MVVEPNCNRRQHSWVMMFNEILQGTHSSVIAIDTEGQTSYNGKSSCMAALTGILASVARLCPLKHEIMPWHFCKWAFILIGKLILISINIHPARWHLSTPWSLGAPWSVRALSKGAEEWKFGGHGCLIPITLHHSMWGTREKAFIGFHNEFCQKKWTGYSAMHNAPNQGKDVNENLAVTSHLQENWHFHSTVSMYSYEGLGRESGGCFANNGCHLESRDWT